VPERKLPMRQIKEVLRLHHEAHLSERQIARGCRVSRSTVQRYLERAAIANLSWPLPESLDDTQLDKLPFPPAPATVTDEGHRQPKPQPDFTKVHHELKSNKNVTLQLLWQKFVEQHPNGAHYSWFCQQYREWTRHVIQPAAVDVITAELSEYDRRMRPVRLRSEPPLHCCPAAPVGAHCRSHQSLPLASARGCSTAVPATGCSP
jgi:transposase